jgi:glycogen operon protein
MLGVVAVPSRGVVVPHNYSRDAARQVGNNTATVMKSVVVDVHTYDWEGDTPLQRPSSRTIVYEMHVRGFTRHPSSGASAPLKALQRKFGFTPDSIVTAAKAQVAQAR